MTEPTFGDNIHPSEVTDEVRRRLVKGQLAELAGGLGLLLLIIVPAVAFSTWFGFGFGDPRPKWTLGEIYLAEGAILGAVLVFASWISFRKIHVIRNGLATKGIILDVETMSWYGKGGGSHVAKVFFRFLPAELSNASDSDLLAGRVQHFDERAKITGRWGSFGADLRPGTLVSVLYDPEKPFRHAIVPFKRHER